MSVFKGNVLEYPGIIVDRFNPVNCRRGRAFFLSHCHKDHMSGLDSDDLLRVLKERKIDFYCSEVTQSLLSNDPEFSHLIPYLVSLPVGEIVSLRLEPFRNEDESMTVNVTLLPAGHCPGSVMFLFQGDVGNVLYTGDFRLTIDDVKRCGPLHVDGKVIDIKTIYLDTTFCHPKSMNIITRDETRDLILEKVKEWLSQSPDNIVQLECRSFGYEHIFLTLSSQLDTKIHIDQWKRKSYSVLPSVLNCLTEDGNSTRIHACFYKKGTVYVPGRLPCGAMPTSKGKILRVKPSAQWFLSNSKPHPSVFIPEANLFRVLHSMHSSYAEIIDFVSYLSPVSIIPCVIPFTLGDTTLVDLHSRLRHLLRETSVKTIEICDSDKKPPEELNVRKRKKNGDKAESGRKRAESTREEESDSSYETNDEFASEDDEEELAISPAHPKGLLSLMKHQNNGGTKRSQIQPDIKLTFSIEEEEAIDKEVEVDKEGETLTPGTIATPPQITSLATPTNTNLDYIDLTQSSGDTNSSCHDNHRQTPDSVIIIGSTSPQPVSPVELVLLTGSSTSGSGGSSPPSGRERSPSVVPLTPSKETAESILSKRDHSFV